MNRPSSTCLTLALLALLAAPARAQSPTAQGPAPHGPAPHGTAPARAAPSGMHAAPLGGVQQTSLAKPPHGHSVPIVLPPRRGAAQKPPAAPPQGQEGGQAASPEAAAPAAPPAQGTPPGEAGKGTVTGLPLPRFASLRTDDVNLRAGPGMRYPIDWVYKRRLLPVEIEREFDQWRLIAAPDGTRGWVHQATLVGRRSFIVTGAERTMRGAPRPNASPVARLKPGVVGRLRRCDAGSDWCEVQVGDYRGWLQRSDFWGTQPGEAVQ